MTKNELFLIGLLDRGDKEDALCAASPELFAALNSATARGHNEEVGYAFQAILASYVSERAAVLDRLDEESLQCTR